MNILFITPFMKIGGAEQYIINKSVWLKNKGYTPIVISAGGEWERKLITLGIKHIKLEWINNSPELTSNIKKNEYIRELEGILQEYYIDIVESNQFYCAVWTHYACEKLRVPYLLNVLSEFGLWKYTNHIEFYKIMNKKRRYYNLGDECNKYIERLSGAKLDKCKSIPIPICINQDIDIDDKNYILTVARMAPEKMYIKELIYDFYKLHLNKSIDKNMKLIIVGDGPKYKEINCVVKKLNEKIGCNLIELKGFIQGIELDKLYAEATIYVGMGTTLLTAAAYKKPALMASYSRGKDCYGYLMNTKGEEYSFGKEISSNRGTYYDYINKVLDSKELYKEVSEAGYKIITENFNLDSVMNKWIKEYDEIISNESKSNDLYEEKSKNTIYKTLRRLKRCIKNFKNI